MLVLDLRPWKSFDNVSSANEGQHDAADNLEVFQRVPHDRPVKYLLVLAALRADESAE